jgi:hypothetical protein
MEPDWYYTSSSSCSNEATSCSTFGSSTEFDSGTSSSDNVGSGGAGYGCKELLFKDLEALHDPVITELVKSNMGVLEDPDADTLDSMLYSNGLDEFGTGSALGGVIQGKCLTSTSLHISFLLPNTTPSDYNEHFVYLCR